MRDFKTPLVSISIVNLDGKDYLGECLGSIRDLDYPREKIETIVVDNGSTDGSVQYIEDSFNWVNIIKNTTNNGFAPANNQAARAAKGDYIAFLNNDTKVDKRWLIELLKPIYGDKRTVCSGSKVLSMDGKTLDFVGGMINFEGKGFQTDYGLNISSDKYLMHRFSPFVNGGAMLIDRRVFLDIGGFDDDFFAYYEDVDLGWRLWVLGYKVLFCPDSVVYHAHHGTSKRFREEDLRFLKERNSLIMMYKNYEDKNLPQLFSLSGLSLYNRVFVDYDTGKGPSEMKRWPASSIAAYKDFRKNLKRHKEKRKLIQENRKRPDVRVFSYFKGWYLSASSDADYAKDQTELLQGLNTAEIFKKQLDKTLLMVTLGDSEDILCRYLCMARVLSEYMEVILAVPEGVDIFSEFEVVRFDDKNISMLVESSDILYTDHKILSKYSFIKDMDNHIIVDCSPVGYRDLKGHGLLSVNESFYYGDLYVSRSEKQKNYIIGMLSALGRINPYIFIEDPTLDKLVCSIPEAIPTNRPISTRDVSANIEGLDKKDFIILNICPKDHKASDDDYLLLESIYGSKTKESIKSLFLGFKDDELRDYAERLGLSGKKVFFITAVEKDSDMVDYLRVADVSFMGRKGSYRQFVNTLWAGIPTVALEGSDISDTVEEKNIGKVCGTDGLPGVIGRLVGDKEVLDIYKENICVYRDEANWERLAKPILDFCMNPVARAKRDRRKKHDLVKDTKELGYFQKLLFHLRNSGLKRTVRYSLNLMRGR